MADLNTRIEQFRKMASDDPDNELGHFSLGRALLDAGQFADAASSFERAIQINPNLSKAYQLLATALLNDGKKDAAVVRLTEGVKVAAARGDVMPKNQMMQTLKELGAPVPEVQGTEAKQVAVGEGEVKCARCGRIGRKLPKPPFSNAFGQEIYQKICADCWREAIGQGTKVINELRLPMNDPQAHKVWDQHIREFLNLV